MIPLIPMNKNGYIKITDYLNTEKQVRLEILSRNQKDLQTQVAMIKHTLEKFLIKIHLSIKNLYLIL